MKRIIRTDDRTYIFQYGGKPPQLVRRGSRYRKRFTVGIIIDTVLRIPPITGVTYRLYYLSQALQERGVTIKIFLCNRAAMRDHARGVLADHSGIEYHLIPERIFYDSATLQRIVLAQGLDILQFEDAVSVLRYQPLIDALGVPVCLELHDMEATLLNGLGFSSEDTSVVKAVTALACAAADITVCMTEHDRKELIRDIGVDTGRLFLVPNPIDTERFAYHGAARNAKNLLFIGNMYYWPNARAAERLAEDIFPKVRMQYPDARLTLVGLMPPKLKKRCASHGAICTGAVADLEPYLREATIGFCPVQAGSGMKVKILNYGAAGIPVVTTSVGAAGYEGVSGMIIEDDLKKYPAVIVGLLKDSNRITKLGRMARRTIAERFGMEKIVDEMLRAYQSVMGLDVPRTARGEKIYLLPKPLWLREGRTPRGKDEHYYVVHRGSIRNKKNSIAS